MTIEQLIDRTNPDIFKHFTRIGTLGGYDLDFVYARDCIKKNYNDEIRTFLDLFRHCEKYHLKQLVMTDTYSYKYKNLEIYTCENTIAIYPKIP